MKERAPMVAVEGGAAPAAERGAGERLPRRAAIGGVSPTQASPEAPAAGSVQMFADAVCAGIYPVQRDGAGAGDDVHRAAAHGFSGGSAGLPHLSTIQQAFGRHDVSGVKAHVGGVAAEGAAAMGARAYASGDQVAFASSPDLHLAAHEAAHVVQQRGGVQLSGGVGAVGDVYEQHADAVADLVTRGESAEALLDVHAGSGGGGVQRAVQRWGAWDGVQPVALEGQPSAPIVAISPTWLAGNGVPRGHAATISAASHPPVFRAVVDVLVGGYPQADRARLESGLGVEITAAMWSDTPIRFRPTPEILSLLVLSSAPAATTVQLQHGEGGELDVLFDTERAYPARPTEADRRALATQIVVAVETELHHPMLAAPRTAYLATLTGALPTARGLSSMARFAPHLLEELFGPAVMAMAQARAGAVDEVVPTGEGDRAIPGGGADREAVRALLVEILGRGAARPPEAPPATGATPVTAEELAQLSWLAAQPPAQRQQILAVLREMRDGSHHGADAIPRSADLASAITIARNEADRRIAATAAGITLLDGANAPVDTDRLAGAEAAPPAFPRPIRGVIRQPTVINVGNATSFTFDHQGRDILEGQANPRITIQWAITGPDGAQVAHEDMQYVDVPSEAPHPFAATMATAGHYAAHAFVSHDWYYPAHLTSGFEVVEPSARLDDMIARGAADFGTADPATERPHEFDVAGSASQREGTIREGELVDADVISAGTWATGVDIETDLGAEIARLERARTLYAVSDRDTAALIDARLARLRAMQNRVHALGEETGVQHAEVQAHYANAGEGGRTADLRLAVTFRMEGPTDARRYLGELWDESEVLAGDAAHITVEEWGFHAMMEALFNGISAAYPSGEMAFSYQIWEHEQPTPQFRELRRVTDTLDTALDDTVFSPHMAMAINIGAALISLFPPTSGIGIAIATTYNAMQFEHSLERQLQTDTVNVAQQSVQAGQLLLDIIPGIAAASSVTIGGRVLRVIEAAGSAGDAYMFFDNYETQLQQLHDSDVTELAQAYADLEAARANAASDDLEELQQNLDRLQLQVQTRADALFTQMAAQEGLMRLSMHAIHALAAGADPHGDAEPEGPDAEAGAPAEAGPQAEEGAGPARAEEGEHAPDEQAAEAPATPHTHVTDPPAHGGLSAEDMATIQSHYGAIPVLAEEGWGTEVALETVHTDDGIHVTHLRVGANARLADVLGHFPSVAVIERYNGMLGQVRRLFDEMRVYLAHHSLGESLDVNPFRDHPESVAWDAWHEVQKLERIIPAREAALRDARVPEGHGLVTGESVNALRESTEFLRSELARHRDEVQRALRTGEGLEEGSGTGSIRTREETTALARRRGYPRPSSIAGVSDENYWFIHAPEGSAFEYQIVRRDTAPSTAPVLHLAREGGRITLTRERSVVDTFPEGPRTAYAHLAERTREGQCVALSGVAPTELQLGSIPGFVRRITGFCREALQASHPDWSATRITNEARRLANEVGTHQITVIRGTDALRGHDYARSYREEHGDPSGDLHHLIPLYLGGDHTRLLDMQPEIHDRLHRYIDSLELGGIMMQPGRAHRSSELAFAEGAAVLFSDGTVQLYRFDAESGNMERVGAERVPVARRGTE